MILILSANKQEATTEEVMNWLSFSGCKYTRLNEKGYR